VTQTEMLRLMYATDPADPSSNPDATKPKDVVSVPLPAPPLGPQPV
jgi:hypothetical protein